MSEPRGRGAARGGRASNAQRGDSRGGGGDTRGGRGDPRGSRGDTRGGRGDFRGGRGDFRGGRADFRGGRGGFRGRGDNQQLAFRPHGGPAETGYPGVYLENSPIPQPDSAVTAAEDDRVKQTRGQIIDGFPGRPGHGTQGKKIILRANYFAVRTAYEADKPEVTLYRYAVSLSGTETLSKPKLRRLIQKIVELDMFNGVTWATDFATMIITTSKLPLGPTGKHQGTMELDDPAQAPFPPPQATDSPQIRQARTRRTKSFRIEYTNSFEPRHLVDSLRATAPGSFFAAKDDIVQIFNIVMAKHANNTPDVYAIGGNKFYPDSTHMLKEEYNLDGGLRALRGYYASVRTASNRILLNLNVSSAAFYKAIPLRAMMNEVVRNDRLPRNRSDVTQLEGHLRLLRVETNYLKAQDSSGKSKLDSDGKPTTARKRLTIVGFANSPRFGNAKDVKFTFRDANNPQAPARSVSVYEYFQKHHSITLQYWQEPVVNVGTAKDPVYLPVELASVMPGQAVRRLLSGYQTAEMIKFAARAPNLNAQSIAGTIVNSGNGLVLMGLRSDMQQDTVQPFGFRVATEMITVPGRILISPSIQYKIGPPTKVQNGSWNVAGKQFAHPGSFGVWSVLIINHEGPRGAALQSDQLETRSGETMYGPDELFDAFESDLKGYGLRLGPRLPTQSMFIPPANPANRARINNLLNEKLETAARVGIDILLVILREADRWLYSRIKFFGDVKYGVQTVCAIGNKIQKPKGQGMYFGNLALKFNIKGGGIAHTIPETHMSPLDKRTMLVGIDVTHPSPGSKEGAPSIAGVVANVDSKLCQWPGSLRSQTGRKEMVEGLTEMVLERLDLWRKKNQNSLPDKLIIYRDGVSEGQYRQILDIELPAIQEALKLRYGGEKKWPKITIIVVGKRHHTRFYPTCKQDADARSFNPQPGTVVDRGVTDHFLWDFFLQAHQGLQGTARPAHYVVIMDQIGFQQDQLEQFTHRMCYLFNRATKAVSICPPAYYADLICERGRSYLFSTLNENQGADGDAATAYSARTAEWSRDVHDRLKERTFYI